MRRIPLLALLLASLFSCSAGSGDAPGDVQDTVALDQAVPEDTLPACTDREECDDGDPCTLMDQCNDGTCVGEPKVCQQTDCSVSSCNAQGTCETESIESDFCLIDGTCVAQGEGDGENACRTCQPEISQTEFSNAPNGASCEDGNVCTEFDECDNGQCATMNPPTCADGIACTIDSCNEATGCSHELDHASCADENPCTLDLCDPEQGGCVHVNDDTLVCGDGDVCTPNDRCEAGACVHDDPVECEDGNPCTDEFCHPSFGCLFMFNEVFCSDGADCTLNDVCHYGQCVGEDAWGECPPCAIAFDENVVKVNALRLGDGGHPGEALNIDNDLKTCSPDGDCEAGLDNVLSFAGELINDMLTLNLEDKNNPVIVLVELKNPTFDGSPFDLSLLYGGVALTNLGCNVQMEECVYRAAYNNFDALCKPYIQFKNATINGDLLTGGGSGYVFPYMMYFEGGTSAEAVLFNAKVQGTVETNTDGRIIRVTGVLGGAVTPDNLTAIIDAIPAAYFPGGSKDLVLSLVAALVPDIDINGDGTPDALSINFVIDTIPGSIEAFQY